MPFWFINHKHQHWLFLAGKPVRTPEDILQEDKHQQRSNKHKEKFADKDDVDEAPEAIWVRTADCKIKEVSADYTLEAQEILIPHGATELSVIDEDGTKKKVSLHHQLQPGQEWAEEVTFEDGNKITWLKPLENEARGLHGIFHSSRVGYAEDGDKFTWRVVIADEGHAIKVCLCLWLINRKLLLIILSSRIGGHSRP